MALVKCSECGHEVSSKATACPNCGAPIADAAVKTPTQTVQQTSKTLKAQYAIATVVFFIGLIWLIFNLVYAASTQQSISLIPVILTAIGAIWGIVTKIRIWWYHK